MEDSISCSPGNEHHRSWSQRLRKKMKRKKHLLDRVRNTPKNKSQGELPFLEAMYENITNSPPLCADFNPFEDAFILAAADTVAPQSQRRNLTPRGFIKLEELNASELGVEQSKPDGPGPETQFGITESEFVRFCDEIQIDQNPQPSARVETPKAPTKSIVDIILEDFCGSPYDESPPRTICDDATPIFRFKSKSLRTYSRRAKQKPLRRNIECELVNVHLLNDDSNGSMSSGLSVQEDLSQNVVPQLDTVDLNKSIRVCENLLNLSMHFSQDNHSPVENRNNSLTVIVEDIMRLKQKTFAISRAAIDEDFYGFTDGESDCKDDTLKDLLEDEDELLQQINCDSHCYDESMPKKEQQCGSSVGLESILEDVDTVIARADRLIMSMCDVAIKNAADMVKMETNCDTSDSDALPKQNSLPVIEQLAVDLDLWNDNDFLLDYATQPPNDASNIVGNRPNTEIEQPKSNENPLEAGSSLKAVVKCNESSNQCNQTRVSCNEASFARFEGFSTASRKPIAISTEAKRRADELLTKFEREVVGQIVCGDKEPQQEASTFIGFVTASKKHIAISEEAKRRANNLLAEFAQKENGRMELPTSSISEAPARKELDGWEGVGFSTASRKPITISKEAQRKAEKLLEQFEQPDQTHLAVSNQAEKKLQDVEKEAQEMLMGIEFLTEAFDEEIPANVPSQVPVYCPETRKSASPIFEGFKTASKKPIQISDAAKERAELILKTVETTDAPRDFLKCLEADLKCATTALTSIPEEYRHVNGVKQKNAIKNDCTPTPKGKRKLLSCDNPQDSPTLMSPRRLSCDERSPLNAIGNINLRKTPSLPLIKSTSKASFLSRRNLLSLSKRKKYSSPEKTTNPYPVAPKTPLNGNYLPSPDQKTIATPNLKAFFDSVSTSTPRLVRKTDASASIDTSIDPDVKKIDWGESTNSVHVSSTRSITDLNVTEMEVSPSPKQRIERLKMYGEPPAISPISMINKCRPSGLRRGRSLMKS